MDKLTLEELKVLRRHWRAKRNDTPIANFQEIVYIQNRINDIEGNIKTIHKMP